VLLRSFMQAKGRLQRKKAEKTGRVCQSNSILFLREFAALWTLSTKLDKLVFNETILSCRCFHGADLGFDSPYARLRFAKGRSGGTMTTIVTRLYSTAAEADAVVAALKKAGFSKFPVGAVKAATKGDPMPAMRALGVYEGAAKAYAGSLKGDAAMVIAHAPFAKSFNVAAIMDAHHPLPSPAKYDAVYVPAKEPPSRWSKRSAPAVIFSSPSASLALSDGMFPPAVIRNHRPLNSVITNHRPKAGLVNGTFSEKIGLPLLSRRSTARA
jgi:hypothetical protein